MTPADHPIRLYPCPLASTDETIHRLLQHAHQTGAWPPQAVAELQALLSIVEAVVPTLPPLQQRVLEVRFGAHRSETATALYLGIPLLGVRNHLHRACITLAQALGLTLQSRKVRPRSKQTMEEVAP
jgi:DNA-directed RNA polymerase specialized sigma24 family protein